MITASARRTLVALAIASALLPATPALAQTATPTIGITSEPELIEQVVVEPAALQPEIDVDQTVIDYGNTHLLAVFGDVGAQVQLYANGRLIRTDGVLNSMPDLPEGKGVYLWELQPGDTTTFYAIVDGVRTGNVVVRVRRTVTIGISQASGVYTFTGTIGRGEPGVQVTVARLDAVTKRITGVASAVTNAVGDYTIRTPLPVGQAGYYALTAPTATLDAGRSRLYGLIVPARVAPRPVQQSVSLNVRLVGRNYVFSGAVANGRNVPVTLARNVNGQLIGVRGGRTSSSGAYSFSLPLGPGTYFFQTITASATSRPYGLVVPEPPLVVSAEECQFVLAEDSAGPYYDYCIARYEPRELVEFEPEEPVSAFYANCTAARRAGAAPVFRGEPGYGRHLDRDNDGVGCE